MKKPIRIAIVRNGERAHYAKNIQAELISTIEKTLNATAFLPRIADIAGDPTIGSDKVNEEKFNQVLKALDGSAEYIITIGTEVSKFAKQTYLGKIPLIFVAVSFPVESGLVSSLDADINRGCIAGTSYGASVDWTLDFLNQAFPNQRLGLVFNPQYEQDKLLGGIVSKITRQKNFSVNLIETNEPKLDITQQELADIYFGRLYLCQNLESFLASTQKQKPFIGVSRTNIERGAIAMVGCDERDLARRVVDEILKPHLFKEEKLELIPILQPNPLTGLNLDVAKNYGFEFSKKIIQNISIVLGEWEQPENNDFYLTTLENKNISLEKNKLENLLEEITNKFDSDILLLNGLDEIFKILETRHRYKIIPTDNVWIFIQAWYKNRYGRVIQQLNRPRRLVILIRDRVYLARFSENQDISQPLSLIENTTPGLLSSLNRSERQNLEKIISHVFEVYQIFNNSPLIRWSDLESAIDRIHGSTYDYGEAKWSSLKFVEKTLKNFIGRKGQSYPFTHDLKKLVEIAQRNCGLKPHKLISSKALDNVECRAGVRYGEINVTLKDAIKAHHSSINICEHIVNTYNSQN